MANMFGLSDDEIYSVALSITTICSKMKLKNKEQLSHCNTVLCEYTFCQGSIVLSLDDVLILEKVLAPMRERFKQYEGLKEYVSKPLTSK